MKDALWLDAVSGQRPTHLPVVIAAMLKPADVSKYLA